MKESAKEFLANREKYYEEQLAKQSDIPTGWNKDWFASGRRSGKTAMTVKYLQELEEWAKDHEQNIPNAIYMKIKEIPQDEIKIPFPEELPRHKVIITGSPGDKPHGYRYLYHDRATNSDVYRTKDIESEQPHTAPRDLWVDRDDDMKGIVFDNYYDNDYKPLTGKAIAGGGMLGSELSASELYDKYNPIDGTVLRHKDAQRLLEQAVGKVVMRDTISVKRAKEILKDIIDII